MSKFDTHPKYPEAVLENLAAEKERILGEINILGRFAVQAVAPFGFGPLAENAWMTRCTKRKIVQD